MAFKHGKYAEVSSQSSNSAFKNVAAIPPGQTEPIHLPDAPKEIPTTSVAIISLPETPRVIALALLQLWTPHTKLKLLKR